MKITDWPLLDRPREKLINFGTKSLSDAELLAIILQVGTKGKTALDLARELLYNWGSLKKLQQATPEEISELPGLGKAKYALLMAAFELGKRATQEQIKVGEKITSSQAVKHFLTSRLQDLTREVFGCLFLNIQNRILGFEELFQGGLTESPVYPREVAKRALAHHAAKVILAHNHPSGNPMPSLADKEVTQLLKKSLALVEIQVLDHIIIGLDESFSFAEAGWL